MSELNECACDGLGSAAAAHTHYHADVCYTISRYIYYRMSKGVATINVYKFGATVCVCVFIPVDLIPRTTRTTTAQENAPAHSSTFNTPYTRPYNPVKLISSDRMRVRPVSDVMHSPSSCPCPPSWRPCECASVMVARRVLHVGTAIKLLASRLLCALRVYFIAHI